MGRVPFLAIWSRPDGQTGLCNPQQRSESRQVIPARIIASRRSPGYASASARCPSMRLPRHVSAQEHANRPARRRQPHAGRHGDQRAVARTGQRHATAFALRAGARYLFGRVDGGDTKAGRPVRDALLPVRCRRDTGSRHCHGCRSCRTCQARWCRTTNHTSRTGRTSCISHASCVSHTGCTSCISFAGHTGCSGSSRFPGGSALQIGHGCLHRPVGPYEAVPLPQAGTHGREQCVAGGAGQVIGTQLQGVGTATRGAADDDGLFAGHTPGYQRRLGGHGVDGVDDDVGAGRNQRVFGARFDEIVHQVQGDVRRNVADAGSTLAAPSVLVSA